MSAATFPTVRLCDVCEFKPPKSLAKRALSEDALVSFVPMNDLGELRMEFQPSAERPLAEVLKSYTYFADGDVICAKITPCFENGKMGVAAGLMNGVGFGSSEFVVMRPSPRLLPQYLFYFMLRDDFREAGAKMMTGAVGHKRVPNEFFERLEVPLPPLEKQKRIVAVLDQAFAALDRARALAEANLADAQALLSQTVEAALCALGEPQPIGRHVDLLSGFAFKSGGYTEDPEDIRLIRGDNIVQGAFRWDGVKRWPKRERSVYARYELAADDVLIAMDRTWVSAGIKYAVVDEDALPSLLVQRVARLRTKSTLLPSFLALCIGSKLFERYVLDIQTGLGVPHVSGKQLEAFEVPIPEVDAQRDFVEQIEAIRCRSKVLMANLRTSLSDIAGLRQSVLQKAFAGELT